ncbi:MAG: beta-galactosidase [Asticcacaulis sp.]
MRNMTTKGLLSLTFMLFPLVSTAVAQNTQSVPTEVNKAPAAAAQTYFAQLIYDFGDAAKTADFKNGSTQFQFVSDPESSSGRGLRVDFDNSAYSRTFTIQPAETWDWVGKAPNLGLVIDASNPSDQSVDVLVTICDASACGTRHMAMAAGARGQFYYILSGGQVEADLGLRGEPKQFAVSYNPMVWAWGTKKLDMSQITKIELVTKSTLHAKSILLHKVWIEDLSPHYETAVLGIADAFGQRANVQWPGKIENEDELISQSKGERQVLAEAPSMTDRSKFGGWKSGPKLDATGYFRTEKIDGRWTLVDPEGYLYFAMGLDSARLNDGPTMTGIDFKNPDDHTSPRYIASVPRRAMFSWLPKFPDHFVSHYGYFPYLFAGPLKHGETFDFYATNLDRKYGKNYFDKWKNVTLDRMLSWGFTGMGNWADPAFFGNGRLAYFAYGNIDGKFQKLSSGSDYWGGLADPYDPKFAEAAQAKVKDIAAQVQNDPWCIGTYIDNELSWGNTSSDTAHYGLVLHTLSVDAAGSFAKAHFSQSLKDKYKTIEALNAAWQTSIDNWAAFDHGVALKAPFNLAMTADLSALLQDLAEQYYSTVRTALKAKMPHHLYVGSRLADWGMSPEVIRAAAKYADVVSYNLYTEGLVPGDHWKILEEVDKPSMIGEFSMGALDRGQFHAGIVFAADQQDRARQYSDYVQSILKNPYFVGAQWFQYVDEPLTGRGWDGENYNVGFVSATDTPYPELVEAAKKVNSELYPSAYGAIKPH